MIVVKCVVDCLLFKHIVSVSDLEGYLAAVPVWKRFGLEPKSRLLVRHLGLRRAAAAVDNVQSCTDQRRCASL